jgi:capsule polysaccharide export protein KpsE/RkpR
MVNTQSENPPVQVGTVSYMRAAGLILCNWRKISLLMFLGAVLGAILGQTIKVSYTARATFLPPHSQQSTNSMFLQFEALGGMASSIGGVKDPSLIYIGILESRSVADELIRKFNLQDVYGTKKLSATEKQLAAHTKFIPGKDSLVTVTVEDHDAQRAADLANTYLIALNKQNDRLAITEAAQRRVFFETQLEKEKNRLADAELELARIQEQTGLIHPTGQTRVQIDLIAQTQAEIASRKVQLQVLSQGATDQNPETVRLRSEIAGYQERLAQLENSTSTRGLGDVLVPTSKVPKLALEYIRQEREVKYHDALYGMLLRQLESAKLDESRSAPFVQVLDAATPPDSKSWPPRTLLILIAIIGGGFVGVLWALLPTLWREKMRDPVFSANWSDFRDAARSKLAPDASR